MTHASGIATRIVTSLFALSMLAGCSLVLAIEDARVDPSLAVASKGAGGTFAAEVDSGHVHGSGGSMNVADGDIDGWSASPVCQQYCADIMALCTAGAKQYLDTAQCLKVCALFPEGIVSGTEQANTAACRLKYAGKARYAAGSERDAYCRKAGPGSDGSCGDICDGFCTLMMPTCTATKTAPFFFPDDETCLSTCRALKDEPPYSVSNGTLPDMNNAQCRLFHVTSAVMDPDEHCEHSMGITMCDPKTDGGK